MGGLVFAKRKRSVFKGPMLNNIPGGLGPIPGERKGSHSRSTSLVGRRSGEQTVIEEEDEDVEEVDYFPPVRAEEGEVVTMPMTPLTPPVEEAPRLPELNMPVLEEIVSGKKLSV